MSREDKIEQLEKRLQSLEKKVKIKFTEFDDFLCQTLRKHFSELYFYIAREIKNEADIDILKEFLIEKGNIDYKEYMSFRKEHKLMKTYADENKNALSIHEIFQKEGANPNAEISCVSYVNNSNLIIFKNRLQLKKQLALERGLDDIKEIDELIKRLQDQLNEASSQNTQPVKEKQHYAKLADANKIFENTFIDKKDEIIERIRQIPLMNDLQLEPACKLLYQEVMVNYWVGNFNASIILLSVFVESFLKDKYHLKNKRISEDNLSPLINTCFRENIINENEKVAFTNFAETVRNIYIHSNFRKIIPDVTTQACEINFNNKSNPKLTYVTGRDLPTLIDIQKLEQDKEAARNLIIQMSKIASNIDKRFWEDFEG
jgi:hypothetical protein